MLKISDLVEEIKTLDKLIKKHKQANDSASIISQYEHRKLKFYNELIGELISLNIDSERIYEIIKRIIDSIDKSYFSDKNELPGELDHNLSELEAII